jgi:large subunit ribosomal protein L6e
MGKVGQARQVFKKFGKNGKKVLTKAEKEGPRGPENRKIKTKPKKGFEPGKVLILLAGRFRGKRVIGLKHMATGSILVTGPYEVNGVPLRRVHQKMCICTSTKIDLTGADPSDITDKEFERKRECFKKLERRKKKATAGTMFQPETQQKPDFNPERARKQKELNAKILPKLSKEMQSYLKVRFTLHGRMYPHELKF